MKIRSITAILLAAGALSLPTLGQAAALEFTITTAPPPERVEIVPAPRTGYIYERGHYAWDGNAYVWREGRFFAERQGHVYTPYVFEKRGTTYYYRSGHWDDDG